MKAVLSPLRGILIFSKSLSGNFLRRKMNTMVIIETNFKELGPNEEREVGGLRFLMKNY